MFLKTAVVSYSVGGIPEINRYEEVVKLVEPGNISQLTDEIYQLLLNDRERELLAEKAYQRAKDMFVTKNITTDLINIYHNILTNNNFTY
jgi:glycosyltransferase involved in cell wall biosynthesis